MKFPSACPRSLLSSSIPGDLSAMTKQIQCGGGFWWCRRAFYPCPPCWKHLSKIKQRVFRQTALQSGNFFVLLWGLCVSRGAQGVSRDTSGCSCLCQQQFYSQILLFCTVLPCVTAMSQCCPQQEQTQPWRLLHLPGNLFSFVSLGLEQPRDVGNGDRSGL